MVRERASLQAQLVDAACRADAGAMRELLEAGADPRAADKWGQTAALGGGGARRACGRDAVPGGGHRREERGRHDAAALGLGLWHGVKARSSPPAPSAPPRTWRRAARRTWRRASMAAPRRGRRCCASCSAPRRPAKLIQGRARDHASCCRHRKAVALGGRRRRRHWAGRRRRSVRRPRCAVRAAEVGGRAGRSRWRSAASPTWRAPSRPPARSLDRQVPLHRQEVRRHRRRRRRAAAAAAAEGRPPPPPPKGAAAAAAKGRAAAAAAKGRAAATTAAGGPPPPPPPKGGPPPPSPKEAPSTLPPPPPTPPAATTTLQEVAITLCRHQPLVVAATLRWSRPAALLKGPLCSQRPPKDSDQSNSIQ